MLQDGKQLAFKTAVLYNVNYYCLFILWQGIQQDYKVNKNIKDVVDPQSTES